MTRRIAMAVALVLASGCVTKSEYRAFVVATRKHQHQVSPVYRAAIRGDVELHRQSKQNRIKADEEFERAIFDAEVRLGLRDDPDGD